MRHLEAAAIGLVFAVAAVYMVSLTAHQAAPVHHASAQRALAWALLNARDTDELTNLIQQALGEHAAAIYVDGELKAGKEGAGGTAICYAMVFFEPAGYRVVRVCATP
ncbi:MAG: hypothetical protein QXH81_10605 [Thermofilaceae archaeon]